VFVSREEYHTRLFKTTTSENWRQMGGGKKTEGGTREEEREQTWFGKSINIRTRDRTNKRISDVPNTKRVIIVVIVGFFFF
jgi:hypothetical protein